MRYELSDIADNLPLRRLQEKVIDLLGSVTRVSAETVRILRKQSTSSLAHCVNDSHSLYAHSGHAT